MRSPSQRHFAPENLDPRLRAGLVGHWIGGGSGLTWLDRSGYGRHAVLSGGPLWTLGEGGKRSAIQFDGVDDIATVSGDASLSPAQMTISVWARNLTAPVLFDGLIVKATTGSWNDGWGLWYAGPTGLRFYLNSYNTPAQASATIDPLVWNHIVGTWDGSAVRLFVNGVEGTPGTFGGAPTGTTAPLGIGGWSSSAYNIHGILDDVRIYNRALSVAEIGLLAQPSFLPVVPRRWFVGYVPDTTITTDATAASATWVAPAATARLRLTTQAIAAVSTWFAPSATARTRYTVPASAALSTWVAPSASAQLNRRRSISITGSRSSYSITGSRASYHIEGS